MLQNFEIYCCSAQSVAKSNNHVSRTSDAQNDTLGTVMNKKRSHKSRNVGNILFLHRPHNE